MCASIVIPKKRSNDIIGLLHRFQGLMCVSIVIPKKRGYNIIGLLHRFQGLKGPMLEIFGFRVFSQIRPVWVGDLGTRQKNSKF